MTRTEVITQRIAIVRLPRLPQAVMELDYFETRLALSANAAAGALIEALEIQPGILLEDSPFDAQAQCSPLAVDLEAAGELLAHATSGLSDLLDQASEIRERWQLSGTGQTVAVIDSGIAWDHVALGEGFGPGYRVVGGWDFAENDANPYDDAPSGFHGTHVTGLIAGDSPTLTGVAPGADLVGLRVFDDAGSGTLAWVESALQWVYDHRDSFEHPITTVNLSLGASIPDSMTDSINAQFADELANLRDANIVVVAAAGNQFLNSAPSALDYPAAFEDVWAVASTDASGELSSFSQRADEVLATDGRDMLSSIPDHVLGWDGQVDDYFTATGTSMAAPQIAGAAMLLREALVLNGLEADPDSMLHWLQESSVTRVDATTGLNYLDVDLVSTMEAIFVGQENLVGDAGGDASTDIPVAAPLEPVDVGMMEWGQVSLDGTTEIQVTATRDGYFSFAAEQWNSEIPLQIRDAEGTLLFEGLPTEQINLEVEATDALAISAPRFEGQVTLDLANVVHLAAGHLTIQTGDSDPTVQLDLSNGIETTIGNFHYSFSSDVVTSGMIDGGSRADQLIIQGSDASGRLTLNPYAENTLREGSLEFALRGFEQVSYDGGGGADRVSLYDTTGDDRLEARPGHALLEGVGFRYEVTNVARSFVHATAGGRDIGFLYDSAGDEELAVRPQFVSLRGGEFFNLAFGFERVYAYATEGGHDIANLYDSEGDDRMSASETSARISGVGYYVQAREFDEVTAHATAGGNDLATIYSDSTSSRWIQTSDQLMLRSNDGGDLTARGFETVQAYEGMQAVQIAGLGSSPLTTNIVESTLGTDTPPSDPGLSQAEPWIQLDISESTRDAEASASVDSLVAAIHRVGPLQRSTLDRLFEDIE